MISQLKMITHGSVLLVSTYNKLMHNTQHAYTDVCISHLPLPSNKSWYRYQYSVSEQAKSIIIRSIGKLWHRSHPSNNIVSTQTHRHQNQSYQTTM